MTLPASGSLTIAEIRTELGMAAGATIVFPDATTRWLADKPSGSIVIPTDYHGKTAVKVTALGTSTGTSHSFAGVDFGPNVANRWVVAAISHGDSGSPASLSSVTIGGTSGTGVSGSFGLWASVGDGSGDAAGVGMVWAQPAGTSGTIAYTTSASIQTSLCVIQIIGYNLTTPHDTIADFAESAAGLSSTINVPANGLLLAAAMKDSGNTLTWTGVTGRLQDSQISGHRRAVAFDNRMSVETGRTVSFTGSGSEACARRVHSFPRA